MGAVELAEEVEESALLVDLEDSLAEGIEVDLAGVVRVLRGVEAVDEGAVAGG